MKVAKTLACSAAFSVIYVLSVRHQSSKFLGTAWGILGTVTMVYLWRNPRPGISPVKSMEPPASGEVPSRFKRIGFVSSSKRLFCRLLPGNGRAYTAEGFRQTKKQYTLPKNVLRLPVGEKRTVTICHLFANDQRSIAEISRRLETPRSQVITELIQQGMIDDRRRLYQKVQKERRLVPKYHLQTGSAESRCFHGLCGAHAEETISPFLFFEVIKWEERCEKCWELSSKTQEAHSSSS